MTDANTAAAPAEQTAAPAASTAVTTTQPAPLPAFLKDYKGPIGDEGIDSEDITMSRLKVAQAIQDEVKSGSLKEGSLYIDVTGEAVYEPGGEPLEAFIVARGKEYILWQDRQDGGGVLARARPVNVGGAVRYAWDKPNTEFTNKIGGKVKVIWATKTYTTKAEKLLADEDNLADWGSEIPGDKESGCAATAHHNYLLYLPKLGVLVAASLSRSGVKVVKKLNGAITNGNRAYPLPMRRFRVTTADDQNANGDKYKNWSFKPAGYLTDADAALASITMQYFAKFGQGGYVVDLSEGEVAETAAQPGTKVDPAKEVPF